MVHAVKTALKTPLIPQHRELLHTRINTPQWSVKSKPLKERLIMQSVIELNGPWRGNEGVALSELL
jgi:hypothetical protein